MLLPLASCGAGDGVAALGRTAEESGEPAEVAALPPVAAAEGRVVASGQGLGDAAAEPRPKLVKRVSAPRGGYTEHACQRGRRWFEDAQAKDGSWGAEDPRDTPAVTGLMLLTLAHSGHTIRHGAHKPQVKAAMRYLQGLADADPDHPGRFGPAHADGRHRYNQAIATLAWTEQYAASDRPVLKAGAKRAVQALIAMQSLRGGWPLGGDASKDDTALTIWATFALRSAQAAGIEGVDAALDSAYAALGAVTDASGRATWTSDLTCRARPATVRWAPSLDTLQAGVLAVRLAGSRLTRNDVAAELVAERVLQQPPVWNPTGGNDLVRWWFGTMALFHMNGDYWVRWNRHMKAALIKTQRFREKPVGTWDPTPCVSDPSAGLAGTTCLAVLSLSIYYRYPKSMIGGATK